MPIWYELQDLTLWSLNRELDLKLEMRMWTPGGNIVKIWQNLKSDNTNNAKKSSITQRMRTVLGRSVGVTTATQLVWLTWFMDPTFPLPTTAV